jgi:drug/metabolite transporter (DMT)-like permease
MYLYLFTIQILKTFNIYFRKHILDTLEPHEYLFINTFLIAFIVLFFFLYKMIYHKFTINKLLGKIQKLSLIQLFFIILIAVVTCSSILFNIEFDKSYNTPLINRLFIKVISTILLVIVSVFFFKENYNLKQYIGIFLTVLGLYLTMSKK